jgi:hypothetical protein
VPMSPRLRLTENTLAWNLVVWDDGSASPAWGPFHGHTRPGPSPTSCHLPKPSPVSSEGNSYCPQGQGHGTLQGPLDGVVEVQGGLCREAGSEVNVADARDSH